MLVCADLFIIRMDPGTLDLASSLRSKTAPVTLVAGPAAAAAADTAAGALDQSSVCGAASLADLHFPLACFTLSYGKSPIIPAISKAEMVDLDTKCTEELLKFNELVGLKSSQRVVLRANLAAVRLHNAVCHLRRLVASSQKIDTIAQSRMLLLGQRLFWYKLLLDPIRKVEAMEKRYAQGTMRMAARLHTLYGVEKLAENVLRYPPARTILNRLVPLLTPSLSSFSII